MKFLNPVSPAVLGFFRITISLLALAQLIILWPHLLQLYGNYGFIQWAIIETETDTWLPSIGKVCLLLQDLHITSSGCVYLIFSLYGICLLVLLIGWKTRLFAILAWLLHSITVNSGYISLYGLDTMLHICFFYFIWMPIGANYSIDEKLNPSINKPSFLAALGIRTLQIHLCIIYLNTSIAKMSSIQWWNGEGIWRALMQPQFSQFDYSWLAQYPWVAVFLCWFTLLIEGGYVVFMWLKPTRKFWLLSIISLHLGIAFFMGLWLFGVIMIIMNIAAFGGWLFHPQPITPAQLATRNFVS